MTGQWFPKESDLLSRAGRALDEAYQHRERVRCSRDDFADGFLACLRFLRARSEFRPGAFEPAPEETEP